MDISSIKPSDYWAPQSESQNPGQAAQHRQLTQAAKSVNQSGLLGNNQIVLSVDPKTHRPVIRVENRESHEVLFQAPPQYVLNLAQTLGATSPQTNAPDTDT